MLSAQGCAHRAKDLLRAQEQRSTAKIKRLAFPAVAQVSIKQTAHGRLLQWAEPQLSVAHQERGARIIGYNVYRFRKNGFVSGHPYNKRLITTTIFLDKQIKKSRCYIVRGVIKLNNKIYETPASQTMAG